MKIRHKPNTLPYVGAVRALIGMTIAALALDKERAGNKRNATMDFVEMKRPGEHLAQDDRCPALREHLACHRHGTDLTETGFHSPEPNPKSLTIQVHFLN